MKKKTLTIDIGGTFIKYGLIDEYCQLSLKSKVKTPYKGKEEFLKTLKKIYLEYKEYGLNGIAISAPGLIDVDKGIMVTSGMLTYLEGIHLSEELSQLCDNIFVTVENDAKAAALCESWKGVAKDADNCVVIVFGSGIGGGVVIGRNVLRGKDLIAGEFSPLFIDLKKDSYDNFAQVYSTLAIVKKVQDKKNNMTIDGETIMQLYENNDLDVTEILEEWFVAIAKYCFNIDNILNPDCICIGGGISQNPLFVKKINEAIEDISKNAFVFKKPVVKTCKYYNDSNLIGAYYTFLQLMERKKDVLNDN
ncbi:MAG: ROK family protein [Longibaculum sp.]